MNKADKSVKTAGKAAIAKPGEVKPALHAIKGGKPALVKSPPAKPAAKPAAAKPIPLKAAPPAADDAPVIALNLRAAKLSPAMASYFKKCQDKLGFVPNVLVAYAFDMTKLETFVAMYNDLMLGESGLSKLEREMIAVAVSSQNRCYYCLTAHGAAVRQYSARSAARRAHGDELSRRAPEQAPARHARLRGQAHGHSLGAWRKPTASGCGAPDFPTATSGTFRRWPVSSTCRTASPAPPTCGRTRSITARRAEAVVPAKAGTHPLCRFRIVRVVVACSQAMVVTGSPLSRGRQLRVYHAVMIDALPLHILHFRTAARERTRLRPGRAGRASAGHSAGDADPRPQRHGGGAGEPRRPHRRRNPRPRRQRGRCGGGGRFRARGHLSARRQYRRRRLHADPSRQGQPRYAIDYRETAPAAATRDMFLDAKGEPDPAKSRDSALAIGVPGTVAGLALARQKYGSGKLSLAELIAPAIRAGATRLPGGGRHRRLACRARASGWRAGRRRREFF